MTTGADTVRIFKLSDIKAEYNGVELPEGNPDNRFTTNLRKSKKIKITWDAPSSAITNLGYELKIQCMLLLPGTNYTIDNISGMSNGDGTLSGEITLPNIDDNTDYEMLLFAGLWKAGADDATVGSVSYDGKFFETEPDNNGCYAPMQIVDKGYIVSGTTTSFGSSTDDVTIQLIENGTSEPAYETIVKGNSASYSISNVKSGTYTMKVMKKSHAAREYTVTVGKSNVTKNAKICLLGDVNMDGNISVLDVTEVQNGIAGALELSEYQNKLADVNNDGSVSINDVTQIQNIIAGF